MRIAFALLAVISLAGCGEDTVNTIPNEELDAAVDSTSPAETAAPADTSMVVEDSGAIDTSSPDTAKTDSIAFETPAVEVGGVFSCASETCSATLQFCRRGTSPGTCPMPDSGICPAGCPGCAELSLRCETMPMKCWAKPSCNCILVEVCGSVANGTCIEKDGGFVAGCNGV